ncbi:hypothetical protein AB1N83_006443 [Pleurotus pulmonarius]
MTYIYIRKSISVYTKLFGDLGVINPRPCEPLLSHVVKSSCLTSRQRATIALVTETGSHITELRALDKVHKRSRCSIVAASLATV